MDFLASLHLLSYQRFEILFLFLHNTSINTLFIEVERIFNSVFNQTPLVTRVIFKGGFVHNKVQS